jgi:predicted nucleic acid-binding protein
LPTYVVDTHALVWYIDGDRRLSDRARKALDSDEATLVIPSIVLAEVRYLIAKKRVGLTFDRVMMELRGDPRVAIHSFDLTCVQHLDSSLDLHDGAIVATAIVRRDLLGEDVALITRDPEIRDSGLVKTVW